MAIEERPTPVLEQAEAVRGKLEVWLSKELGETVSIPELTVPEGTGMSNITMMFDARTGGSESGQTRACVARIQPQGDFLVFPTYDLGLQCDLMQLVADNTAVPLPELIACETGGDVLGVPFYIMKKTEGLIPADMPPYHMDGWLMEQNPLVREKLWYAGIDAMAGIHCMDIETQAVREKLSGFDVPKNLDEQLTWWEDYYQWAYRVGDVFYTHECAEKILPWLREHQPREQALRLCWGDSRMANIIFNTGMTDVAAVLDWEMAVLGDPLQDLAWWIYMDELFSYGLGCEPLEGIPSREATARHWAEKTGLDSAQLDYYLVYAGLRFALLLGRMSIGLKNEDGMNSRFNTCFEVQFLQKTCQHIISQ